MQVSEVVVVAGPRIRGELLDLRVGDVGLLERLSSAVPTRCLCTSSATVSGRIRRCRNDQSSLRRADPVR
jgi:hypothetical protein